ncbi:beta-4C adrenergic receptor-like [Penaeus indicus]|uniref:beta-4C adrenergic receptor-like n=1 Tax=Penaeus indicus TaxID=29960 RepID=UPI00300D3909
MSLKESYQDTYNNFSKVEATVGTLVLSNKLQVAGFMAVQILLAAGVFLSVAVIAATILHSPRTRAQYLYWYLLNLSIATLISGLTYIFLVAWCFSEYIQSGMYSVTNPEVCIWTQAVFSYYRSILCSTLLLIALERYITILKPLTHCYIITDCRIKTSIFASWGVASIYMIWTILQRITLDPPKEDITYCYRTIYGIWRIHLVQWAVGIVVITIIVPFIYIHLHIIARKHLEVIQRERRLFGLAQHNRNVTRSNTALKITLTIVIVEVPFLIINFVRMYWTTSEDLEHLLTKVSFVFLPLSHIIQPVLYATISPDFRKSFRSLLGRNRVQPLEGEYP